jgi:predicted ATPase
VLTLTAEQQMLAGRQEAAFGTLDRAVAELTGQHNRFYEAETARMRGKVLLAQSPDNAAAAGAAFREALAVASRQANRPLELRAALSLARLRQTDRGAAEARTLLQTAYGAFTEGFDEPDLQAARTLLAAMS